MRFEINFNKAVNRLVPPFMRGRRYILFIQSLVHPLQGLNDAFVNKAAEFRIEATMTSQIIRLKWYLNHKFSQYFVNSDKSFQVVNAKTQGLPVFHQRAYTVNPALPINVVFKSQEEAIPQTYLKYQTEQGVMGSYSFIVTSPKVDFSLISEEEYVGLVRYAISRYALANKTFIILFDNE